MLTLSLFSKVIPTYNKNINFYNFIELVQALLLICTV
jgi:hypothetical protein